MGLPAAVVAVAAGAFAAVPATSAAVFSPGLAALGWREVVAALAAGWPQGDSALVAEAEAYPAVPEPSRPHHRCCCSASA